MPKNGHGPVVFGAEEGHFANNFKAGQLNAIAGYAFSRSRPLFDLADKGEEVTLKPEEIRTLADSFEEIAFQLGDGFLFDPEQTQKSSRIDILGFMKKALHRVIPHVSQEVS